MDNKGCQHSIEAAENQAQGSAATMVAARRGLNRKAKGKPTMPEDHTTNAADRIADAATDIANIHNDASITAADAADAADIHNDATSNASTTAADATNDIIALDPQASDTNQEELDADTSSFAFTCSWVPQMANLHVHWCERRAGGIEIYHMNLIRGYLMSDGRHVADFRKDVHNILDWGVSGKRKAMLKDLEKEIAKQGRGDK